MHLQRLLTPQASLGHALIYSVFYTSTAMTLTVLLRRCSTHSLTLMVMAARRVSGYWISSGVLVYIPGALTMPSLSYPLVQTPPQFLYCTSDPARLLALRHQGQEPAETAQRCTDVVEPLVDQRRLPPERRVIGGDP